MVYLGEKIFNEKEMNKFIRSFLIFFLVVLLIMVRAYLAPYFYDPLNNYFKNDYLYMGIPKLDFVNYFMNILLRFTINSGISLIIIYLIFKDLKGVRFAVKFYSLSFIVLGLFLFILLMYNISNDYMLAFYVRRFLIHPIFLLVLVPAFYFQKLKLETK